LFNQLVFFAASMPDLPFVFSTSLAALSDLAFYIIPGEHVFLFLSSWPNLI
jgi:hypothetical protein